MQRKTVSFVDLQRFSPPAATILAGRAERAEQQPLRRRAATAAAGSKQQPRRPAQAIAAAAAAGRKSGRSVVDLPVAEDRKTYEINDIVKVSVSVKSQMTSTGKVDRKKTGLQRLEADRLDQDLSRREAGRKRRRHGQPPYGTPEVRGDLDSKLQAQGDLQTSDKMKFTISCRIVDKRPNGNLVLEGTSSVSDNEEKWEYSLAGECRPEDIKPDNSIVSDNLVDPRIIRKESGSVRDSYRRGWVLQWLDKWQPF